MRTDFQCGKGRRLQFCSSAELQFSVLQLGKIQGNIYFACNFL